MLPESMVVSGGEGPSALAVYVTLVLALVLGVPLFQVLFRAVGAPVGLRGGVGVFRCLCGHLPPCAICCLLLLVFWPTWTVDSSPWWCFNVAVPMCSSAGNWHAVPGWLVTSCVQQ
jgi:hypothetical protein